MNDLKNKKCQACQGGEDPLDQETITILMRQLRDDWVVNDKGWLVLEMIAKDFEDALLWVEKIGSLAEEEGHHPNLYVYDYKKLRIELYTHKINGLHVNDFIVASKIDEMR
jgi:4a-hydroxytetrahydrobiopterin dehydratase